MQTLTLMNKVSERARLMCIKDFVQRHFLSNVTVQILKSEIHLRHHRIVAASICSFLNDNHNDNGHIHNGNLKIPRS